MTLPIADWLLAIGDHRYRTRVFHTSLAGLINTGALARCRDAYRAGELFQQSVTPGEKPLKRMVARRGQRHRAKAPVLMRTGSVACEVFRLGTTVTAAIPA